MTAEVFVDGAAIAAWLGGPDSPLLRELTARATLVQEAAKAQVGYQADRNAVVATGPQHPDAEDRAHLRDTIVKRVGRDGDDVLVLVGSASPIALLHHTGTRPHHIAPRSPDGRLAFYSARLGRVVILPPGRGVDHPGTKPNRYLTDNLHLAGDVHLGPAGLT